MDEKAPPEGEARELPDEDLKGLGSQEAALRARRAALEEDLDPDEVAPLPETATTDEPTKPSE